MNVLFVNVNEEGIAYGVHADLADALDMWAEFPNDSIEAVVPGSYREKVLLTSAASQYRSKGE